MSKGHAKKPLPIHIHDFFKSLTGLTAYADVQLAQLLQVCEAQKTPLLPRISLFMSQMGLKNRDAMPPLDVRDTDFILDILENLVHQGELTEVHTIHTIHTVCLRFSCQEQERSLSHLMNK